MESAGSGELGKLNKHSTETVQDKKQLHINPINTYIVSTPE